MLADKIAKLVADAGPDQPWQVVQEPHAYPDGTSHFNHVMTQAHDSEGSPMEIVIASYLDEATADLLVTLYNNREEIIAALRLAEEVRAQPSQLVASAAGVFA